MLGDVGAGVVWVGCLRLASILGKEEARMNLHKVYSQMEYGCKLIANAHAKLLELEAERDTMKAKMDFVRPEEGGLDLIDIDPPMVDFEGL